MKQWGAANRRLYYEKEERVTEPWREVRRLRWWVRFYGVTCVCLVAYVLFLGHYGPPCQPGGEVAVSRAFLPR